MVTAQSPIGVYRGDGRSAPSRGVLGVTRGTGSGIITLDMPSDVPDYIAAVVARADLPNVWLGGRFSRTELASMEVRGRRLVRFGRAMISGSLCIDIETGVVVEVWPPNIIHTNASFAAFVSSLEDVLSQFPFYSNEDEGPDIQEAGAAEIERRLRAIDPTSWDEDGFWVTFRWDVANGDFPTEDIPEPRL